MGPAYGLAEMHHDMLTPHFHHTLMSPMTLAQRLLPQLAFVFDGHVAALLQLERRVDGQVFAGGFTERFRPSRFARIAFAFEEFVTFAAAEFEDFAVVADELNPVTRIYG